ncbi:hypothetical protein [Henriciella aquimarina]|uniref:hypothetical protein n=1 Tax=Henriciella aquimarina TaxID=545261 RepID=UPI0009FBFE0A|nr:hypothetical protein [Henriciella aquimarina]
MSTYPNTVPAVREALQSYVPPESIEGAFYGALSKPPVPMFVACFDLLKEVENDSEQTLDDEGRKLLCGCAELINLGQWFGKASEALTVLMNVAPTLPEDDQLPEGVTE